jgi:two-component system, OmpR family, phosphate regulon sensor histidine kinase PhoR
MPDLRQSLSTYPVPIAIAVAATTSIVAAVLGLAAPMVMLTMVLAFGAALTALQLAVSQWARSGQESTEAGQPAEASWRAIVEAMTDPAIVLNREGRVLHSSRAAHELFVNLRDGQALLQVSRNPDLLAAVEAAADSGLVRSAQLLERVPIERRLSVTISPLRESTGAAGGPALLLVFRDVSEEERLAQMRADFIANASHELRTPLTSLRGFIETLQGQARDDPAARKQFLEIMAVQATRMTRLLDDLLSLSRLEMRVHVPPRGEVEINEIVNEVTDLLEPIAQEAGIALAFAPAPAECHVRGDHDELVQVFQNLVQNAIKYGRRGGRVDVAVGREPGPRGLGDRVAVEVKDDGPGIAEEHLPRLTERFYRVDVAESRDKGGTGLGLAIVKHVLNRHHGQLRIRSRVGVGSTFTVLLDALPEGR